MVANMSRWCVASLFALAALPVSAVQVTDNLNLGGAIRARMDYDPDRDIKKTSFDAIALSADYNSDTWVGAARYWFYGNAYPFDYTDKVGDISFPEYAWIGYNLDSQRQVQVGLNQVPFGILPYFGSTFTETLGYVVGLEDLYQVGGKYVHNVEDWNIQAGYYIRPAYQGKGTSRDGVTYSNVVANADDYVEFGSDNQERDLFALRVTKTFKQGDLTSEVGISALTSTLKNGDTDDNGRRNAVAVHYTGTMGPWALQLLGARQQMSPRNPENDDLVTFGGYDASYNVAARGNLLVAGLDYNIPGTYINGWVNNIKLYGSYSAFLKSGNDYNDTERYIAGASFYVGNHVLVAAEWLFGKNDPYVGGSDFVQSMAAGGTDHWEDQAFVNIGYYF